MPTEQGRAVRCDLVQLADRQEVVEWVRRFSCEGEGRARGSPEYATLSLEQVDHL